MKKAHFIWRMPACLTEFGRGPAFGASRSDEQRGLIANI